MENDLARSGKFAHLDSNVRLNIELMTMVLCRIDAVWSQRASLA